MSRADVVVVGSGASGMTAALALAPLTVALVTKTPTLCGGASPMAMGGIAAAVGPDDDPFHHGADTIAAAAGLADPEAVKALVHDGPKAIARLVLEGTRFDRGKDGHLALGREAAHSRSRIVRAGGDGTGAEVVRALAAAVLSSPRIDVRAGLFTEDLVCEGGQTRGIRTRDARGVAATHPADAIVLATGGIGRIFAETTNPVAATGDGLAIAARAGAKLADLEFVQFHPTALAVASDPMPLVTEAIRGAGAVLVDERGRVMTIDGWQRAELAPRDVLAWEISLRLARGERIALDARSLGAERLGREFPAVLRACRAAGYDPCRDPIPVAPAAHYHVGGVAVDLRGRTSVEGVWACGEVACTGAHGANRLASNSLLEALVFGARAAEDIRRRLGRSSVRSFGASGGAAFGEPVGRPSPRWERRLRAATSRGLGIVRDGDGIRAALADFDALSPEAGDGEARNMVLVGRLVAAAALVRAESRGAHRRRDLPDRDARFTSRLARTAEELLAGALV
ncbi:MAG TPA: L-aspartate oxidase [Candidatus Polarisedimenticolaceae bacterium]|nr:L-aspartate oxidase [Candidatus Polarisedimenticolaceae bacterium]